MGFVISLVLPFFAAIGVAMTCTLVWRAELSRPWLFFALSVLLILGAHRLVEAALELGRTFGGGGYFLERSPSRTSIELLEERLTIEACVVAAVAVAISYPLLLWVKGGAKG